MYHLNPIIIGIIADLRHVARFDLIKLQYNGVF